MMITMRNKLGKRKIGMLFVSCAAALICAPAYADVTFAAFSIEPVTQNVLQGGTGSFDLVVTDDGPGSISVQSSAFEISVGTGVTITGADFSTGATYPYIFTGDSFAIINGIPLYSNPLPAQTLTGGDGTNDGAGITLTPGESLGLADVLFSVSPSAALGPVAISFIGTPTVADSNNLSDPNGTAIPVATFTGGTIDIVSASSSTPEPSSILLTLAGAGALAGWARRKRRAA